MNKIFWNNIELWEKNIFMGEVGLKRVGKGGQIKKYVVCLTTRNKCCREIKKTGRNWGSENERVKEHL